MTKVRDIKSQKDTVMNLEQAIAVLSKFSKAYPEEAIKTVLSNGDKAKPYLYEALDKAILEGKSLDENYQLHFYSLFLLGELADTDAFEKIVALATLPPDVPDHLLGDVVTCGLSDILYSTFNGNMELLKVAVKNAGADDFSRAAMLEVLGQLYLDGKWSREAFQEFLKEIIYNPQMLGDYVYAAVQGVILDCHFKEMLPEVRFMLDAGVLDTAVHGGYDDSVDMIFTYGRERTFCKTPVSVDCLRHWAMFTNEDSEHSLPKEDMSKKSLKELLTKADKDFYRTEPAKKVKLGRNDPCPCGSGKKYKFCCMNKKSDKVLDEIESEAQRKLWLEDYPKTGTVKLEGRLYLDDFYDEECIVIDQMIYLALHHRAIPIWRKEEEGVDEKRRKRYLGHALDKFMEKMEKEGFNSLSEYDEKCSIHYMCWEWMENYRRLLGDEIDSEHYRILRKYLK